MARQGVQKMNRRDGNTFKKAHFAEITVAMVTLYETEWFMHLVKEWTLTEKEGDVVIDEENILEGRLVRRKYLDKYGITYEGNGEKG